MRVIFSLILVAFLYSCSKEVKNEDLKYINGYWTIEKVKSPDNNEKIYNLSKDVDFFELNQNTGYRQKVEQQADGTLRTNMLKEKITLKDSINKFFIKYETNYDTWTEEIIAIDSLNLTLKNANDIYYYYKRYQPIQL